MEIGAGMNFVIIAKFIPTTLGLLEIYCREPPPVPCVPALRHAQPSPISHSRTAARAAHRRCRLGLSLPPSLGLPPPYVQQSTTAACHQPYTSPSPAMPLPHDKTTAMVRTHGGHRYRPRVQFSTPKRRCWHFQGCRCSLSRLGCRDTTYIGPCCYIRGGSGS